jgi:tetratricopeptide (TPR) repeat protein
MEYAQAFLYNHLGLTVQGRQASSHCRHLAEAMDAGEARDELLMLSVWPTAWTAFSAGDLCTAHGMFVDYLSRFAAATNDFTLCAPDIGARFWVAHALAALGTSETTRGNYAAAVARWKQAIALRVEIGEQRFLAFNLFGYAKTATFMGDLDLALDLAQRGLALSESFGDQVGIAEGHLHLGMIAFEQGQWAVANHYLHQSLALGRQSGNRWLQVGTLMALAGAALGDEDVAQALAHGEEALRAASVSLPYMHLAPVLTRFGECALAVGDLPAARRYFVQALRQAPNCPAWSTLNALWGTAQVLAAEGDADGATRIVRLVAQDPATAATTRAAMHRHDPVIVSRDAADAVGGAYEAAVARRATLVATMLAA